VTTKVTVGTRISPPQISADGRFVAFFATDSYKATLYDQLSKTTTVIGTIQDIPIAISNDGHYVALATVEDGGGNGVAIYDRLTKKSTKISTPTSAGGAANLGIDNVSKIAFSTDLRYMAYASSSSKLVPGDTNGVSDIFVYDRLTRKAQRVSVAANDKQANERSGDMLSISADGRYVAFISEASNLVPNSTNTGGSQLFVHDRIGHKTTAIKGELNYAPSISADGRYVAFYSGGGDVGAGNVSTEGFFVHDRVTQKAVLISGSQEFPVVQGAPHISADGRFVVFTAPSEDEVFPVSDVYSHDRLTQQTTMVSVNTSDGSDYAPNVSADGRYVTFVSDTLRDTGNTADVFIRDRLLRTRYHADLKITATQQPKLVRNIAGTYLYTIVNNGSDPVSEVNVLHVASLGGITVSLKPSQGKCVPNSLQSLCQFGKLDSGKKLTLSVTVKAQTSPFNQDISVSGEPIDTVPANNYLSISTPVK
jgi:Tol biopolymer transport system component